MIPGSDTSVAAARVQADAHRRLSGPERVRTAAEMSESAREICARGVRARHPDWTPAQVRREVLVRVYGRELVDRVWPDR